jgi:hypothetical protein
LELSEDLLDLLGAMAEDDGFLPHDLASGFGGPALIRSAILAGLVAAATRRAPVQPKNPIIGLFVTWRYDGYVLTEDGRPLADIGRRMRLAPRLHAQGEQVSPERDARLRRLYLIEAQDWLDRPRRQPA